MNKSLRPIYEGGRETVSTDFTARELASAITQGNVKAVNALEYYLTRINRYNGAVNSVVIINPEALAQAAEIDRKIQAGEPIGPLAGVPFLVKDTYKTEGIRTASGGEGPAKKLRKYIPAEDAEIVAKLKSLGAILIGKTATPTLAMDMQTRAFHGTTNNPYDLSKTPGGSSGGCAASMAMDFAMFSVGSDAGGSGRVPAAFCSVDGHKVSRDLVDRGIVTDVGHIPPLPGLHRTIDLGAPAILARRVEDIQYVMEALGAPVAQDNNHIRLGYLDSNILEPQVHTIIAIQQLLEDLISKKIVSFRDPKELRRVDPLSIARVFGETFGKQVRQSLAALPVPFNKIAPHGMASGYTRQIEKAGGRFGRIESGFLDGLKGRITDEEIDGNRANVKAVFTEIWKQVDAIIMPTAAIDPFTHRPQFTNVHETESYFDATMGYTAVANVIGAAATQISWESPVHSRATSFQIMAPTDAVALQVARQIEAMWPMERDVNSPDIS